MEDAGDLEQIKGEYKEKKSRVRNFGATEVAKAERDQPRVSPSRVRE